MKVYISGKITGDKNYKTKFQRAEKIILENGNEPINPAKVTLEKNATWADYMKYDLHALLESDAIYMLKDWKQSKGARLERYLAKKLKIKIIYETKLFIEISRKCSTLKKENEELKEEFYQKSNTNHSLVEQLADKEIIISELKEQVEKVKCKNIYAVPDELLNSVPCYTVYDCKHCSKRS